MGWLLIVGSILFVLVLVFWKKIPALWKSALPTGVVTTIDTITFETTQAMAKGALKTLIWAAVEHGDVAMATGLVPLGPQIAAWDEKKPILGPTVPAKLPDGSTVEILVSSIPKT